MPTHQRIQPTLIYPQFYDLANLVMEEQSNAVHKFAKTTDDKTVHDTNLTLSMLRQKISSR